MHELSVPILIVGWDKMDRGKLTPFKGLDGSDYNYDKEPVTISLSLLSTLYEIIVLLVDERKHDV